MLTYSQSKLYSSLWRKVSEAKGKKKAPLNKLEEIIETDECNCCPEGECDCCTNYDDFEPETATSQLNRAIPGTKSDAKEVSEKSLKERNEEELARSFDSQAESITYSARVIQSLKSKAKEHNAKSSKKVSNGQLKKMYRRGAESFCSSNRPGKSRGQWAMARVNTFLGMTGEGGDIIFDLRSSKSSDALVPSEEDLTQADKDLAEAGLGLNIDFEVDELYIEEYETSSMLHC